jgi:hypothetical protein
LKEERRLRLFENRLLRKIYGAKQGELKGEWRKLHNVELNDLHSSTNIVRVNKSIRVRWAGHVEHKGRGKVYTGFWWEKVKERDHLEDPGMDGRIILRRIFRK